MRPLTPSDRSWAESLLDEELGGRVQARRGESIDVLALPGFVAERDGRPAGLLTYRWDDEGCELACIVARERYCGIGTELVAALVDEVGGRASIWLVTTNDNLGALRFYQRRGFALSALRPGALEESRRTLKPEIGLLGEHGIPLRDELELELRPEAGPSPLP